jgi:hypothetical protein
VNSNSCGRGLVVFSLTLIFGLLIADQFAQSEESFIEPPLMLNEASVMPKAEKKLNCVREYDVLNLSENRFPYYVAHKTLNELTEQQTKLLSVIETLKAKQNIPLKLEETLINLQISQIEEKLEETKRDMAKLKSEGAFRKNDFSSEIVNENALYLEKCVDVER